MLAMAMTIVTENGNCRRSPDAAERAGFASPCASGWRE